MRMIQMKGASMNFTEESDSRQMNGHTTDTERHLDHTEVSSSTRITEDSPGATTGSAIIAMDSAGSSGSRGGTSGDSSCGLVSSLFPSSCRGRAEAFARRLHHRLTSLGGDQDSESHESPGRNLGKASETSWLQPAHGGSSNKPNHVHERQPRQSSDSDLYFDFDIDIDDDVPGSPAEEATDAELAELLVNPKTLKDNHHEACHCSSNIRTPMEPQHQDSESGCVFSSPATGTSPDSDSEVYFDPESSETDKNTTNGFFDPITASDSDTSNFSNGELAAKISTHRRSSPRPEEKCRDIDQETSESSESVDNDKRLIDKVDKDSIKNIICSSCEDSLNGKSSLDTTSPSHESLWSTFDDSTLSLQDDSPSRISNINSVSLRPQHVPKSHSDSEIPLNRYRIDGGPRKDPFVEVDEVDFHNRIGNGQKPSNDTDNVSGVIKHEDLQEMAKKDEQVCESLANLKDIITTNLQVPHTDDPGTSDTDTDHSTYSSTINIPGALTLEYPSGTRVQCSDTVKNEVKLQIKDGEVLNGTEESKMIQLLKRLGTSPNPDEDNNDICKEDKDLEDDYDRPQRVRRCSSLKTGKTPPGTPGHKKIVRFADVLGLDLADVRTFLDEIPKIPNSAYSDLIYDDTLLKEPVKNSMWTSCYQEPHRGTSVKNKSDRTLVTLFQQPGGLPNFLDLVRERQVCLENVVVQDPTNLCLQGTVRVRNLDFHKSVHIRYTLNSWLNFSDLQATYVPNSCDGFSDKFAFILYCHTLKIGQRLEFAVRFQCKGAQYWDNNGGVNYCFQCLPIAPNVGYIPITNAESNDADWSPTFY
ncbi:glycogen-binding subunit 76A isoform X2 [Cephus cinctus]|uniref:Glycogen-binding subunit 76A isoform X2 n=1 Tax=Cephus cinctus TaxID=211228 RepID=A0AAJ7W873_CEPCN|nr:glycogen-binding subunit 76A isoform X2 [Cephus cinctus]XP_024947436.1 glycogen-binding subunit 76A isoform X2 [Cephus cinctus]